MTAQLVHPATTTEGLQPLDISRHLSGMADLVEICFAREMETGGRAAVNEMRFLSQFGPILRWLNEAGIGREIWSAGAVWVENGQLIGCTNTQPLPHSPRQWVIANVAVHPNQRRRGIAFELMAATLDDIRAQGGERVLLQVDDDNLGAVTLYKRLGFSEITVRNSWTRAAHMPPPPPEPSVFDIRLRDDRDWANQLALAASLRPEGLRWTFPIRPSDFRPNVWRNIDNFFNGQIEEHWLIEDRDRLIGNLIYRSDMANGDALTLLVHPEYRGLLEKPLLVRGLRRAGQRGWAVRLEHPADDETANAVLRELGFQVARTLRWMQKDL